MSQLPGLAARQGLMEIDPNRVIAQHALAAGKSAPPVVSAVPLPPLQFAPGPLPAPVSARPAAARPQPPAFLSGPAASAPNFAPPKKRKSDVLEDGASGVAPSSAGAASRDADLVVTDNCDVVRTKIRSFIESGEMKVGEFQRAIGVSAKAYGAFMKQDGAAAGQRSAVYKNAFAFFSQLDPNGPGHSGPVGAGSSNAPKRAKKDDGSKSLDVSGVTLPGEEHGRVPVFDTCNEIRKKIRAFQGKEKEGLSQATFCRELTNVVSSKGRRVTASGLAKFMGQKGATSGAGSIVFYAAYVYFEKMRIRDGKPKSHMRQEMESVWGEDGIDLPEEGRGGGQRGYYCLGNERPYEDRYGKIHFTGR